jgi:hypothetical protein
MCSEMWWYDIIVIANVREIIKVIISSNRHDFLSVLCLQVVNIYMFYVATPL